MAERVVLHVGAMKSGTSYIQSQLFTNQAMLHEQGVLVPGRTWSSQVAAVVDAIGRPRPGQTDVGGAWQAMVDQMAAWPGTAIISMEFLGVQGPARVRKIVSSFGDTPLTVVLTVRDLNRSIAAMWQETVQNGRSWPFAEYYSGVEEGRPGQGRPRDDSNLAGRKFWRQQNTVRLTRNWMRAEGVDDFALVTVPHPGAPSSELMSRFAKVAGLDASGLQPSSRANPSLDAAATEVLRRTNALLAERGLEWPHGAVMRKQRLAKAILAHRRRPDLLIGLPVADWVSERAEAMVRSWKRLGVEPVGDWADLDPVPMSGVDPDDVADADLREAADRAVEDLGEMFVPLLGEDWERELADVTGKDEADLAVRRLAALVAAGIRARGGDDA
jgi:hypothetical protein